MATQNRKTRERRMRQQEIQAAAREVFAAKGFNGATMEEIADKADYSPATIYLYFKNKQDLYTSLIVSFMEHLAAQMEGLADSADLTPLEKLDRLPGLMVEAYQWDPATLVALFHIQASVELKELRPETSARLNSLAARSIHCMARIFEQGMARGEINPGQPLVLADGVWGIFTGLVLWEESKRIFDPRKQFLKPTLEFTIKTFVNGVRRPTPQK